VTTPTISLRLVYETAPGRTIDPVTCDIRADAWPDRASTAAMLAGGLCGYGEAIPLPCPTPGHYRFKFKDIVVRIGPI